jgi:hypothetical protein
MDDLEMQRFGGLGPAARDGRGLAASCHERRSSVNATFVASGRSDCESRALVSPGACHAQARQPLSLGSCARRGRFNRLGGLDHPATAIVERVVDLTGAAIVAGGMRMGVAGVVDDWKWHPRGEELVEALDKVRIELHPAMAPELSECGLVADRGAVRTAGNHRLVGIRDGNDACPDGISSPARP